MKKSAEKPLIWHIVFALTLGVAFAAVSRSQAQGRYTLPPPADAAEALRLDFYKYDRNLPLNPALTPLGESDYWTRQNLTYDSAHDQKVTAILALPKKGKGPFPAVILVHGSGGHKDTGYIMLASAQLCRQGFATLAIDTQYHGGRARLGRSGEIHMPDSYTMRDAWVQSVIDVRRAVDYLQSRPDIDAAQIGYLGFSQGAMLGSVAVGVEERIGPFCLAVPGGGLVDIVRHIDQYPVLKAHWPIQATPDVMQRIEDISNVTDPIHYIGRIGPRPLLIIVAKYDEIIPPEASAALVKAAHADETTQVKRWASGHVLNPAAIFDIQTFFVSHLRADKGDKATAKR